MGKCNNNGRGKAQQLNKLYYRNDKLAGMHSQKNKSIESRKEILKNTRTTT